MDISEDQATAAARRAIRHADEFVDELIVLLDTIRRVDPEYVVTDEMATAVLAKAAYETIDDDQLVTTLATAVLRLSQARKGDAES